MLDHLDALVESHGDEAQKQYIQDDQIELEDLGTVDDQVSETSPRREKFAYDNTHQREADIDLCGA